MILPKKFYAQPTQRVAPELLGQLLVFEHPQYVLAGKIVEVEAYLPEGDPGCHAAGGKTPRNSVMFGPPGFSYVYFCYGNHFLLNVVTEKENVPGAVLIRSVEPIDGIEWMQRNRRKQDIRQLTNGPGKLTQAFGITKVHNQMSMVRKPLYIQKRDFTGTIGRSSRIGLSQGSKLPLRFFVKNNPFVSEKRTS